MTESPNRKHIRWRGYDYGIPAYYFITICTQDRLPVLSRVDSDATIRLLPAGEAIAGTWEALPVRYAVVPVAFLAMPDHVHAILGIEPSSDAPTLGTIIGAFKSLSWRRVRARTGVAEPLWQRGYHDRVIRSSAELDRIGEYFDGNPARWLTRSRESIDR